jgi:hypothetical protein
MKLLTPGKDGQLVFDWDDVVQRNMTVVRDGEKIWPPPPVQVSAAPGRRAVGRIVKVGEGAAAAWAQVRRRRDRGRCCCS